MDDEFKAMAERQLSEAKSKVNILEKEIEEARKDVLKLQHVLGLGIYQKWTPEEREKVFNRVGRKKKESYVPPEEKLIILEEEAKAREEEEIEPVPQENKELLQEIAKSEEDFLKEKEKSKEEVSMELHET